MSLSEFVSTHREQILSEWVDFARSCLPTADGMNLVMLRDHAAEMLAVIAEDLRTKQSRSEQADKSEGKRDADPDPDTVDTAAQAHGAARAESGFSVEQMVSEYRALRASVTRLWVDATGELSRTDLDDLVRFNEAIDQALAESTSRFTQELDRSKEMFIAMLGHDLRTPLGVIVGSAQIMVNTRNLPEVLHKRAAVILSSGQRMGTLVGDILDFTRSRLGGGIPIVRADVDLGILAGHTVEELRMLYPHRTLSLNTAGDLQGEWDRERISQALSNVINNAVQHGADTTPITVAILGDAEEVRLTVHNHGPIIPRDQFEKIFDPMHRVDSEQRFEPRQNLGLGLYIADRIVAAHGGTIDVESSEQAGTTFTLRLPRQPHRPDR